MRVVELWRYPVKSIGGETLLESAIDELGLTGDRCWGVVDLETGMTLTGRRAPDLLMATARIVDGEVAVTLPDGRELGEGDHALLSAWLGRDVELRPAGPDGGRYENPLDAIEETDWVEWTGPPGTFHDSARSRFTLVSTRSLRAWDVRRFRTNVVVDGEGEDQLVGRRIALGDGGARVVAEVDKRVDRCVMVTRPQPGLERDLSVLTTLRDQTDLCLSVGCTVVEAGRIALGSPVSPTH